MSLGSEQTLIPTVTKIGEAKEAPVVVCLGAGIPRGVVTFCMGAPSMSLFEVTEGE